MEILEDHEESVLQWFMKEDNPTDIDVKVCTDTAHYCDDDASEEYVIEENSNEKDEL